MDIVVAEMLKMALVPTTIVIANKYFDRKNVKDHERIEAKVDKVLNHFEIGLKNSESFRRMDAVKAHYVAQFKTKGFQVSADEKANKFIELVTKTVTDHPKMSTTSWLQVSQDFDTGYAEVKKMMETHLAYMTEEFFADHAVSYQQFKSKIEAIFMDVENKKKERFLKASNDFLIKFMGELIMLEKFKTKTG